MLQLLFSMIALFQRIEPLGSFIHRLPPNRANIVAAFFTTTHITLTCIDRLCAHVHVAL